MDFNHPGPGQFIALEGKTFEIITHRIEWDESGITAKTDLQEVNDEGEHLDVALIVRNLDMYDYGII